MEGTERMNGDQRTTLVNGILAAFDLDSLSAVWFLKFGRSLENDVDVRRKFSIVVMDVVRSGELDGRLEFFYRGLVEDRPDNKELKSAYETVFGVHPGHSSEATDASGVHVLRAIPSKQHSPGNSGASECGPGPAPRIDGGTPRSDERDPSRQLEPGSDQKNGASYSWERAVTIAGGSLFIAVMIVLSLFVPNPTTFQYTIFRTVIAISVAAFGSSLPGTLGINLNGWLKAGGCAAVFVIVYFYNPASLVANAGQLPSTGQLKSGRSG
jgi:hypothetical protein